MADTHVTITGNLTDDPELKHTGNGNLVVNFRLAVTAASAMATAGATARPARDRRPAGRGRRRECQPRPCLLAEFQADPSLTADQGNGQRPGPEVGE